jgi:hypothetical protein
MHEERDIGDYKVQVTEYAGGYQAAIYPTKKGAPLIDWKNKPIWSPNVESAFLLAQQRIDAELAAS